MTDLLGSSEFIIESRTVSSVFIIISKLKEQDFWVLAIEKMIVTAVDFNSSLLDFTVNCYPWSEETYNFDLILSSNDT